MKLTDKLERAVCGIAWKLTRRVPELFDDVCQEGRLAVHLFQPWMRE